MIIYNCHVHIFTIKHIPDKFLPGWLMWLLKFSTIRAIARRLDPTTKRDMIERYINFAEITLKQSQEEVFQKLQSYYPKGTNFIILPMDMTFMNAGKPPVSIREQHNEIAKLYKKYPKLIYPFIAVDPRHDDMLATVKHFIENENFKGLKLYPSLGYFPTDSRLDPIYEYANEKELPIMTHCTRGGVYNRKIEVTETHHPVTEEKLNKNLLPEEFSSYFADPSGYEPILEKYPKLRICLSHFGGNADWSSWLGTSKPETPIDRIQDMTDDLRASTKDAQTQADSGDQDTKDKKAPLVNDNWLDKISEMLESGKYPNLYTDISYTIFENRYNFSLLKVLLATKAEIRKRVLFGSDYYMVEQEEASERGLSVELRAFLGEDLYRDIAETNPKSYLGI